MWEVLAIQLAVGLVATGMGWFLKKIEPSKRQAPTRSQPWAPATEYGRALPLIYGTNRISPIILWGGNKALFDDTSTSMRNVRADLLYGLGTPSWDSGDAPYNAWRNVNPPKLLAMWVGDKKHTFDPPLEHGDVVHVEIDLGGRGAGGTFSADIEFFDGRANQTLYGFPGAPTTRVERAWIYEALAVTGVNPFPTRSSYRHIMCVSVLTTPGVMLVGSGSLGEADQAPPVEFEVESAGPNPCEESDGRLTANPALVAYDLLAGEVYKAGLPADRLDLSSFEDAGDLLVGEEGHGFSMVFFEQRSAVEMINEICAQTNAAVFENKSTGLIEFKPIRLVEGAIPEANVDNTVGRPDLKQRAWTDVVAQVNVKFTNRELDYQPDSASAGFLANAFANGGRRREKLLEYPGCHNLQLARALAARDLAALGGPFLSGTVTLDCSFYELQVGDVFTGNWPAYNITDKVFRVLSVDVGQPNDSKMIVTVVEDVFSRVASSFPGGEVFEPTFPYLLPAHELLLTEAPAWMQQRMYDAGILTATSSEPLAYTLTLAANTDDAIAQTLQANITSFISPPDLTADRPFSGHDFQKHATVKTEYPRTAEPYDTSTGLELENISSTLEGVLAAQTSDVADSSIEIGGNLSVLYDPETGDHEFIAFAANATISGGRELTKVWRGLLDTAPRTWPVGTRFVHLHTSYFASVGREPRFETSEVERKPIPAGGILTGSGDDPVYDYTFVARQADPMPAADFGVSGPDLTGTQGDPVTFTGHYKAVSHFEGSADIHGTRRSRESSEIVRGDGTDVPPALGTVYKLLAHATDDEDGGAEVELDGHTALSTPQTATPLDFLLGKAGHGEIDVKLRTVDEDGRTSWTDPTVRVTAPRWRNLLANSHGLSGLTTTASANGWTNVTGTVQASQGASSLSQSATGAYFTSATASGGVTAFRQLVDVRGFKPVGLTALAEFYYRNFSDADDTITVEIEAIGSNGSSVLDSADSGALVGDEDLWTRAAVSLTLPAGTTYIRYTVTLTAAGGGDTAPSTACAFPTLVLGQMTAQLLDNPTFEEVAASLTLALTAVAMDGEPTDLASYQIFENVTSVGYDIDIEAVGDHTDVEIQFVVPIVEAEGAGVDVSAFADAATLEAAWEADLATFNPGWSVAVNAFSLAPGEQIIVTFTRASLSEGTHTLVLARDIESEPFYSLVTWAWGTDSVPTTTTVYYNNANSGQGTIVSGGSTEYPTADGGVATDVEVGDVVIQFGLDPSPVTEDTELIIETLTLKHSNSTSGTWTLTVRIDDTVTTSEPTIDLNLGSWSLSGSWTSPGGGIQWEGVFVTSTAPSGGAALYLATTPSETGTLGVTVALEWSDRPYTDDASDSVSVESGAVAPVVVSVGTVQSATSAGSLSIPWGAGHQADDVAIVVLGGVYGSGNNYSLGTATQLPTHSPQTSNSNALNARAQLWFQVAAGSSESNLTISDVAGDDAKIAQIIVVRGADTADVINASNGDFGTASTSITIPGVTTDADQCLVLSLVTHTIDANGAQVSSEANASLSSFAETTDQGTSSGGGAGLCVFEGVKDAAGTVSSTTATLSGSDTQGRIMIAINPV